MTVITSAANPRIKALARLRQRRQRDAERLFPIEGSRAVARALAAGWPLAEAFFAPELAGTAAEATCDALRSSGVAVTDVGESAFRKIAYRRHPDGLLAVGHARDLHLGDVAIPATPLVLVVDGTEKPGNLGAMLRTADGGGVDVVIAADTATDPFNPNVVRASQGALFSVRLAVASPEEAAAWLDANEIDVLAAGPEDGSPPWRHDLTGGVALVVGAEHAGLSSAWASRPRLTIPMAGSADSLNVSAAAAVLIYEAVRQRG